MTRATPSGSANRAPVHYADGTDSPSPTEAPADSASADPSDGATEPSDAGTPTGVPVIPSPEGGPDVADPLTWIDAPNQEAIDAYNAFTCPQDGTPVNVEDDPKKPLVTCEWDPETKVAQKYLLSAVDDRGQPSSTRPPPRSRSSRSTTSCRSTSTATAPSRSAEISQALVCPRAVPPPQFAVVLDGQVLSAPTMDALITNGQAQIEGNFTQASRQEPRHQPQVRRAAGLVLRLQRRDRRPLAGG